MKDFRNVLSSGQILVIIIIACILSLAACTDNKMTSTKSIRLITLDPGHFHAALVQKTMYEDVDSTVHVYAPEVMPGGGQGTDLKLHLERINAYNTRTEAPTRWKEEVYTGIDFFEKMIAEKKGNVIVLSGNNQKKADYILNSLKNGFHVFADKPIVIDASRFEKLKEAFEVAAKNKLVLYDIMTERSLDVLCR